MSRTLVMMGKPPLAGQVKTRLARDIGPAAATMFYRHAVGRTLRRMGRDGRWTTCLAVNASPRARFACWPQGLLRMPQGTGGLGDRLAFVLRHVAAGPVVIIGTDAPQVEPRDIAKAFAALGRHDAVFGPAEDGGYWLIGLAQRRPAPTLFDGVRWSTEHTLDDTIASLPDGFSVARLQTLRDVDSGEDCRALRSSWGPLRYGPWSRGGV